MGAIRGITVLMLIGVGACSACSSDGGGNRATDAANGSVRARTTREQSPAPYTDADVRHSFRTKSGVIVDCVDYFALPQVKAQAARGAPLKLPTPPKPKHPERFKGNTRMSEYMFNGALDEDGNARACTSDTVPFMRRSAVDPDRVRAKSAVAYRESTGATHSTPRAAPIAPPSPGLRSGVPGAPSASDLPGYAHVVTSLVPGGAGSANFNDGVSQLTIYQNSADLIPNNFSHSVMQIWMTAGTEFSVEVGGTGCGGSLPPCVQSVEVGWDQDPGMAEELNLPSSVWNDPVLFTYATPDGYATGCYDGTPTINEPDCSVMWNPYPGASMMVGMPLPTSTAAQINELVLEIQAGDGPDDTPGWWISGCINAGLSEDCTPGYIGWYTISNFVNSNSNGLMAAGEAQVFEAGGEVDDPDEKTTGVWTVPMGSGMNPATGCYSAAYAWNTNACDVAGSCYYPEMAGPVTQPAAYTWLWGGCHAFEPNSFFLGMGMDTYSWWAAPLVLNSTAFPQLYSPSSSSPFPLKIGTNSLTMAPTYLYSSTIGRFEFQLNVLTGANNGAGNNHVESYKSYPNGLSSPFEGVLNSSGAALYLSGLTIDQTNNAFWGWGSAHNLWTNDGRSSIALVQSGFTSVAVASNTSIWATSTSECTGYSPKGNCIYTGSSPTGTWHELNGTGAAQVTVDTVTDTFYALDSSGNVWQNGSNGLVALTDDQCTAGKIISFVQIAAQNNVVFGLDDHGTVFFYGGVKGNCWSQVGTQGDFAVSIATDNGNTMAVWASDANGLIWGAN
jgi:hypothetical protein